MTPTGSPSLQDRRDPITATIARKPDPFMWSEALSFFSLYQGQVLLGLLMPDLHPGMSIKAVSHANDHPHLVIYREAQPDTTLLRIFHAMLSTANDRLVGTWIVQNPGQEQDLEFHTHLHEVVTISMDKHLRRVRLADPYTTTTAKIIKPARIRAMIFDLYHQRSIVATAKSHLQSDIASIPKHGHFMQRRQAAALAVMEALPDLRALSTSMEDPPQ